MRPQSTTITFTRMSNGANSRAVMWVSGSRPPLACQRLDCLELLADPRFVERLDRMRSRPALIGELERVKAEHATVRHHGCAFDLGLSGWIMRR